jgi:flagellar biosynthesis protein FlhA
MATETSTIRSINIDTSNLMAAAGVFLIIAIMIMPIPSIALDIFLALNITISILVLLLSLYIVRPLDFPIYPTLLLVTTLFRLSLNIASTRLILLHGHEGVDVAGKIIMGFGQFAVGGNFVVGAIIFFILIIINFIVITKGAGRIAEVSARFTLDAMPGKQMAIDADLNSGLISEIEAKQRRKDVSRESEFYGAMDGASKFVRGEAVAGIIILAINIIGGFIIGVLQQNLPIGESAASYTLLSIGDGLVTQIPALIISTSAGIIVSRAASETSMGREFINQFAVQPDALAITSVIAFTMGVIPGMPTIPFFLLATLMGTFAFNAYKNRLKAREVKPETLAPTPEQQAKSTQEEVEQLLTPDILELELGYGLIPLVDESKGGDLMERIKAIRKQFAQDFGFIIPPLHLRDNLQLAPGVYTILIKGFEVARWELMPGYLLAINPGGIEKTLSGIPTNEPAFGLPALWINESLKEEALIAGYTVVDPSTVIATHLTEVIKLNADEIIGRQEVQKLLDNLAKNHPKVVEELNGVCPLGTLQKILHNLVKERISIRDLLTIAETISDYGAYSKDPDLLTEYVRQKINRAITKPLLSPDSTLYIITIDLPMEDQLKKFIQQTDHGTFFAPDPGMIQKFIQSSKKVIDQLISRGYQPVILTSPVLRRHLKKLLDKFIPNVTVISHSEITGNIKIEAIETIS